MMKLYCDLCGGLGYTVSFDTCGEPINDSETDCKTCDGKGYTEINHESLLASERSKVIAEVKHLVENIYGDEITVHELYAKLDSMEAEKGDKG